MDDDRADRRRTGIPNGARRSDGLHRVPCRIDVRRPDVRWFDAHHCADLPSDVRHHCLLRASAGPRYVRRDGHSSADHYDGRLDARRSIANPDDHHLNAAPVDGRPIANPDDHHLNANPVDGRPIGYLDDHRDGRYRIRDSPSPTRVHQCHSIPTRAIQCHSIRRHHDRSDDLRRRPNDSPRGDRRSGAMNEVGLQP